jgi:hypothetical protein
VFPYGVFLERDGARLLHLTAANTFLLGLVAERLRDVHFHLYEQQLRDGPGNCAALSEFLQTEIPPLPDETREKIFARRGTSTSVGATAQRWRAGLSPEWQDRCRQVWRPFLQESTTPSRSHKPTPSGPCVRRL